MNKIRLFLCFCLCTFNLAKAQETIVSEAFNDSEGIQDNEILGRWNNNIVAFVQTKYPLICQFNSAMKAVQTDTLPVAQIKASGFYLKENIFYFLYKERSNNKVIVKLSSFDIDKKLKQKQTIALDTISKNEDVLYEKILVSDDKNIISVAFRYSDENQIKFINFNAALSKKWTRKINYENKNLELKQVSVLNDSSNIALLIDMKEKQKETSKLYIFHSKQKKITVYEQQNLKFYDAAFAYNYINKTLYLCAFSGDVVNNISNKIVVFGINDSLRSNVINIDENQVQNADNSSSLSSSKGFRDFVIKDIIFAKNNQILITSEFYKKYTNVVRNNNWDYGTGVNVGIPMGGINTFQHETNVFVYGNIYMTALSENLNVMWNNMIDKNQISENDYGKHSSFTTMNSGKNIRFLYNDELNVKGTVQMYEVNSNGVSKRKTLVNNAKYNIVPRPKFAAQIAANAVILPSLHKGKLVYAKIVF